MSKTSSYVILELSQPAYDEVSAKMLAAGYDHAFIRNPFAPEAPRINMQGIAVVPCDETTEEQPR